MNLVAFDYEPNDTPAFVFDYGCDNLGDQPHLHRWRAWWDNGLNDGVTNIRLSAYRVIKLTPQGAWIYPFPGLEYGDGAGRKRIVFNGCRSSWAKETQDAAIKSLAVRLSNWSQHVARDRRRALEAAHVLKTLRPDLARYAQATKESLG